MPVNIHGANVLWYNKKILDQYGIDPNMLKTWDGFFAACKKLRAAGLRYPIAMGGIGKWEIAHTIERMFLSQGVDFYQDLINGKPTGLVLTKGTNQPASVALATLLGTTSAE